MTRPGDGLRRLAARICEQRTMERLVEPIIADLQAEWDTAAAQGGRRAARWLAWRGYGAFWKALGLHCIMSTFQPSRSDANVSMHRVVAFALGALAIMTALMIVPPMLDFKWDGGPLEKLRLILLLIPQALPLSIPSAICVGVVCAMRGHRTSPRHVAAVLAIAAVSTFMVWTMLEWGVPAANQAFRELIVARLGDGRVNLDPGLNELGLSRLSQRTDPRAVQHSRLLWAICFATGPLALFSLGIAAVVRRFSAAMAVSVTAIVLYWAFMASIDEALRGGSLRGAGAWAANALFLLAGVLMLRYGQKIFRLKPEGTN
jgi:hypothetical protein